MKISDDLEKMFQENFGHFEVQPPEELKAKIDEQLFSKPSKSNFLLYTLVFGVFTLGLTSIYLYNILQVDTISKNLYSSEKLATNVVIKDAISNSTNENATKQNLDDKIVNKNVIAKDTKVMVNTISNSEASIKSNTNNTVKKNKYTTTKKQNIFSNDAKFEVKISNTYNLVDLTKNQVVLNNVAISNNSNNAENYRAEVKSNVIEETKSLVSNETSVNTDSELITENQTNADTSLTKNTVAEVMKTEINEENNSSQNITKSNKRIPFMLSFTNGTFFGNPIYKDNNIALQIKNKNRFQSQFDVSYLFKKSNFSFQTGFSYARQNSEFSFDNKIVDSSQTGYNYNTVENISSIIYIEYGNRIDTIVFSNIDTISIENKYTKFTTTERLKANFTHVNYTIPLLLRYTKAIYKDKLFADISTGVALNFQKFIVNSTVKENTNLLTYKHTNVLGVLKTHLRYQFNHFGFSLNGNMNYNFSALQFNQVKVNPLFFDLGLGIHYRF